MRYVAVALVLLLLFIVVFSHRNSDPSTSEQILIPETSDSPGSSDIWGTGSPSGISASPNVGSVVRLVLVNAVTDTDIQEIHDGDIFNLTQLPTNQLNIRAETNPPQVGSVRFALNNNSQYSVDNTAPYALAGDSAGNYNPWTPAVGLYVVGATPYKNANATGQAGTSLTIEFEIINSVINQPPIITSIPDQIFLSGEAVNINVVVTDDVDDLISMSVGGLPPSLIWTPTSDRTGIISGIAGTPDGGDYVISITASDGLESTQFSFVLSIISQPPDMLAVTGFTLVNATTGAAFQSLQDNLVVDLVDYGGASAAIRAELSSQQTSWVVFDRNGEQIMDNSVPFIVDTTPGNYRLTAIPYAAGSYSDFGAGEYGYNPERAQIPIPANAVHLNPGDNIQAFVDSHPAGTVFILGSGVYRQDVVPKNGSQFYGEAGAVMNGSRLLTNFTQQGAYWVASGQTQEDSTAGICEDDAPRCDHPEDLFFDNVPLRHVDTLAQVVPGTWFFDYTADTIYVAANPAGHVVETSILPSAFSGTAHDVVISHLTIEKYASRAQHGAIEADLTLNWLVQHNTIRLNHGAAVRLGDGIRINNNALVDNGQIGIVGIGDNAVVEWNDIARNNYASFNIGWEAGGTKFVRTNNLLVRRNRVYDNLGPGLWTDINNINTVYEENLILNNLRMGIFHEISYDVIIRNNIVMFNSVDWSPWMYGAQIQISTSSNANIYGNLVVVDAQGGNGIGILQQDRGSGTFGVRYADNNHVHHNTIVHLGPTGESGGEADWESNHFFVPGNNTFDNNTYHVTHLNHDYWRWDGGVSWSELRAAGHESSGYLTNGANETTIGGRALTMDFTIMNSTGGGNLPAPTNLTVASTTTTTISLSWNDISGETEYRIERSNNAGLIWSALTTTSANLTAYTDSNLPCETMYSYRVRATNGVIFSAYSNVATGSTLPCPLLAPTNLTVTLQSSDGLQLAWVDNASDESGYEIERSPDGGVTWTLLITLGANSSFHLDAPLGCDATYMYRLRAYRASDNHNSDYSTPVSGQTVPCAPVLIAGTVTSSSIGLLWNDVVLETAYLIERSLDSSIWAQIAELPANSNTYTDNGLACSTDYYYRLRAYNATTNVYSVYSAPIQIASGDCPPQTTPTMTIESITDTAIALRVTGIDALTTSLLIEYSDNGQFRWLQLVNLILPQDSITDAGLHCEQTRYYRVRAYRSNDGTYSPLSAVVQATTLDCPALAQPPAPIVVSTSRTTATLSIAPDTSGQVNTIYLERSDATSDWQVVATLTANGGTFTDTTLLCASAYLYRVRTYRTHDAEYSPESPLVDVTTLACPIPAEHIVGLYRDGLWLFRDANSSGAPTLQFVFGPRQPGWTALTGDWDGDGVDGISLYRNGLFILRNSTDSGTSDNVFSFGPQESGWQPIVGDWNGDDVDTVGLYKSGLFLLRDSNDSGSPDYRFMLGTGEAGWTALAGDWNARGASAVGLYRAGYFHLTNAVDGSGLQRPFAFGPTQTGWLPLTGDWDGDGDTTIGVYNQSIWRLRNENNVGSVDNGFNFGLPEAGWQPIASYRGGAIALAALASAPDIVLPDSGLATPQPTLAPTQAESTVEVTAPVSTPEATEATTEIPVTATEAEITVMPTEPPAEATTVVEATAEITPEATP